MAVVPRGHKSGLTEREKLASRGLTRRFYTLTVVSVTWNEDLDRELVMKRKDTKIEGSVKRMLHRTLESKLRIDQLDAHGRAVILEFMQQGNRARGRRRIQDHELLRRTVAEARDLLPDRRVLKMTRDRKMFSGMGNPFDGLVRAAFWFAQFTADVFARRGNGAAPFGLSIGKLFVARVDRENLIGDLHEDIDALRAKGASRWTLFKFVWWQFGNAFFALCRRGLDRAMRAISKRKAN